MVRRSVWYVCRIAAILTCVCSSFAEQGMVLLRRPDDPAVSSNGAILLKYLSDGRQVILEDCCSKGARFSPDGKQVVTTIDRDGLYIMHLDGSDRTKLTNQTGLRGWCADGYFYVNAWQRGLTRMRDDGSDGGTLTDVHQCRYDNMGPHGRVHAREGGTLLVGKFEMSLDGTKGVYTTLCNCEGSGWGQTVCLIGKQKEYALTSPCVGSISPHGDRLGHAYGGGHHGYALYPWKFIYGYIADDNCTYYYKPPADAWYLDTIDVPTAEGFGNSMSWSKDPDVLTYTWEHNTQAWMYRLSTHEKTLVADSCWVSDYYPREMSAADTSLYLTPLAIEFETETGDERMPDSITVFVKGSHTLPVPTITGAPAWLSVTAEKFDDDNVYITNALNAAAVPSSAGAYTATLTVSFAGYRDSNFTTPHRYSVTLNVFDESALSFTRAFEPRYDAGETIEIGYTADCERAGDKVNIAISVDNGATWAFVDTSYLGKNCGENQVFSYVIPDSAVFHGPAKEQSYVTKAVEGGQCLIRLRAYHPGGPEVYSSLFGINDNVAETAAIRSSTVHALPLRATLKSSMHLAVLSLRAAHQGTARVLDIQGRTVHRFTVEQGTQSVVLPRLRAGCYLMEVDYAAGGRETVVVNLH